MSEQDHSPAALRGLLAGLGAAAEPIQTDVEFVEYDWHAARYFTTSDLEKLKALGASIAEGISGALRALLRQPTTLHAGDLVQCYADGLTADGEGAPEYCLAFAAEGNRPCGRLAISARSACQWVGRLLGGTDGEEKELTGLEASLLTDAAKELLAAVSATLDGAGAAPVHQVGEIAKQPPDLGADGTTEFCEMAFRTDPEADQPTVRLAIRCDALAPVVGQQVGGAAGGRADAAMMEYFARAAVVADAVVGRAVLPVRDLMNLEPGDVLVLPKTAREPMELVAGDRSLLLGFPVVCGGRYGVQVARSLTGNSARKP